VSDNDKGHFAGTAKREET